MQQATLDGKTSKNLHEHFFSQSYNFIKFIYSTNIIYRIYNSFVFLMCTGQRNDSKINFFLDMVGLNFFKKLCRIKVFPAGFRLMNLILIKKLLTEFRTAGFEMTRCQITGFYNCAESEATPGYTFFVHSPRIYKMLVDDPFNSQYFLYCINIIEKCRTVKSKYRKRWIVSKRKPEFITWCTCRDLVIGPNYLTEIDADVRKHKN
jgi:hypothetical protein